ncbi:hypothetical protein C8J56DRAFT_424438 [Mycena floridula]|nr:hypothetical protein C8J56DRAFT_424438 [Mycena floridula]
MLLDLPPEITEAIVAFLEPADIISTSLTCKDLHSLVTSSVLIAYLLDVSRACLQDNPSFPMEIQERQELLKKRNEVFFTLSPTLQRTIPVPFSSGGLYDLADCTYFLGDLSRFSLHYLRLSESDSNWITFTPLPQRHIVDFGLAINEHDMVAVITSNPSPSKEEWFDLELSLWKLSTGQHHPEAQTPNLHLKTYQGEHPLASMEICGKHLVLVVSHLPGHDNLDHVYVYDWRTGELKVDQELEVHSCTGVVVLDAETFVVTNSVGGTLNVFTIPSAPGIPLCVPLQLALPVIAEGWEILSIICRCDPNPGQGPAMRSTAPFQSSPKTALIYIEVLVRSGHIQSFVMFIQRNSLLETFHKYQHDLSSPIPYTEWGPSITNVLSIPHIHFGSWITVTSGLQFAMLMPQPHRHGDQFVILMCDFHPSTIRKVQKMIDEGLSNPVPLGLLGSPFVERDYFADKVPSLPVVAAAVTRATFPFYHGIMLNEGFIVAPLVSDRLVEKVTILHFG